MVYRGLCGNAFADRRNWCRVVCACYANATDPRRIRNEIDTLPKALRARNVLSATLAQLEAATGDEQATAKLMQMYNLSKPELRSAIANLNRMIPQIPEDNRRLLEEKQTDISAQRLRQDYIDLSPGGNPARSRDKARK